MRLDHSKYLTREELATLRRAAHAWDLLDREAGRRHGIVAWAVIDTLTCTGLRTGELALLDCGWLNRQRRTLTVRRLKRRSKKASDLFDTLPIPADLVKHLTRYLIWKQHMGEGVFEDDPLFCGQRGRLTERGVQHIFARVVEQSALPCERVTPRTVRHTVGTLLYQSTRDLRLVQHQLGHRRPQTSSIYASATDEQRRSAITAIIEPPPPELTFDHSLLQQDGPRP